MQVLNTLSIPHTVLPGTDVLGILALNDSFGGIDFTAISWNGVTPTLLYKIASPTAGVAGGQNWYLYQIVAPTPGSGNVEIEFNHFFTATIAAMAFNIADFGGWRFAEVPWKFLIDPNPNTQDAIIYSDPTDLLLSFFGWPGNSTTVTPDAGQTVIASQSGAAGAATTMALGQVVAPVAPGNPAVQANTTLASWTVSAGGGTGISQFLVAINGLDRAAPAGAPYGIGRVSTSMTLEQQPVNPVALADNPWRWRHETPTTHTTLAALFTYFDQAITAVQWIPDATGTPELFTALDNPLFGAASAWVLTGATPGLGYIRPLTNRRWCGGSAYSLALADGASVTGLAQGWVNDALTIPSTPDGIVIDRLGVQTGDYQRWTAAAGQSSFYNQPIAGTANTRTATTGSNSGASSWKTAVGFTTTMDWTGFPDVGLSSHAAITFLGAPPPPPPGGEGCPDSLPLSPVDGTGCARSLGPTAV